MKTFLIAVDLQKDFVNGALGTKEAEEMIPRAARKIREFSGEILLTMDTHGEDYLKTREGRFLPVVHCVKGTPGWELDGRIRAALEGKQVTVVEKNTFGSVKLPEILKEKTKGEAFSAEFFGLCTDICVVSNALLVKAAFPEAEISADGTCSAGVTPEKHRAALETMRSCQIEVKE